MKSKGFTLIELLAVIVILAIIALIATPIILNIIEDAKEESDERSVELYAKAIQNSIAKSQLNSNEEVVGEFTTDDGKTLEQEGKTPITVEYDGAKVVCSTIMIYEDGNVYLAGCIVNGGEKGYTYGEKQELPSTQTGKPQYYTWDLSGTVGTTAAPATPSTVPPTGKNFYLGYDVTDGIVSAAYACFIRNETEYCLKGNDTEAYETNVDVIKDAYADVVDTDDCYFVVGNSNCSADGLFADAYSNGNVYENDDSAQCYVIDNGSFGCFEF